jgi:hypothetical protein
MPIKRKKLTPEELHPFPTFPYRLEYLDGTDLLPAKVEKPGNGKKLLKQLKQLKIFTIKNVK